MKIAIAQFAVTRGDATVNLVRISDLCAQADALGADLLCLPEMCTTGFDCASSRAVCIMMRVSNVTRMSVIEFGGLR